MKISDKIITTLYDALSTTALATVSMSSYIAGDEFLSGITSPTATVTMTADIGGDILLPLTVSPLATVTMIADIAGDVLLPLTIPAIATVNLITTEIAKTAIPTVEWISTVDFKGTDWDIIFRITNNDLLTADIYADTGISTPTTLLGSTLTTGTRDVTYRIAQIFGSEVTCTTQAKVTGKYDSTLDGATSPA